MSDRPGVSGHAFVALQHLLPQHGISRLVLAAIAMVTLFHPDRQIAWFGCLLIGLFVGYWVLRRREAPMRATSSAA